MSENDFSFYMETVGEIMRIFRYLCFIPGVFIFVDLRVAKRDVKSWIFAALMGSAIGSCLFRISFLGLTGLFDIVSDRIVDTLEITGEESLEILYSRLLVLWIATCFLYVLLTVAMFLIIKKIVRHRYVVSLYEAVYLSIITLIAEILSRFFVKIAVVPMDEGVFILNDQIKASPWLFLAVSILLFAGEVSIIASWQKNRRLMEHERTAISERLQAESLKRRLSEVQEGTERLRTFRHDLRNHVSVLYGLLNEGATEEAESYLRSMEESAGIYEKRYDTGIVLFDVILNDKTVDADRMGITFTASVDIRSLPDMMQYDVAVVVGNLIDNAIHGASRNKTDESFVSIRILEKNGFLWMEIKNSYSGMLEINQESELPVANKSCDDSHGLGIPNSLSICERYYGTLMFSQSEGIVTVTAMMQYPFMT